jgi:hypothetical protein
LRKVKSSPEYYFADGLRIKIILPSFRALTHTSREMYIGKEARAVAGLQGAGLQGRCYFLYKYLILFNIL